MSHLCHQCGVEIDEGSPFCRKCGAPQIRVSRDEAQPAANVAASEAAGGFAVSERPLAGGVDKSVARKQALKAAFFLVLIIASSSFSAWILLLIPFAGILAVQLYYRKAGPRRIPPGVGAGIGLLTGLFGFLIYIIPSVSVLFWGLARHPDWPPIQQLHQQIESAVRSNPNPQVQQMAHSLLSPGGMAFLIVAGSVFLLIVVLVLSAIGGAIGAGIARRRP